MDSLTTARIFAAIGFYEPAVGASMTAERRYRKAVRLSSGMMEVLRFQVAFGRRFVAADDSSESLLISYDLWRTMFGGDSAVIGRRIGLQGSPMLVPIVGVVQNKFSFPRGGPRVDLYLSAGGAKNNGPARIALARLRDGQSIEDARAVVRDVAMRLAVADREEMVQFWRSEYGRRTPPEVARGPLSVRVDRYYREPVAKGLVDFVLLVLACGLSVALIAGANVVNILLVRGTARRQEIAIRMALGAPRWRIVRELVVEAAVISVAGSAVGFGIAVSQWQLIDPAFIGRDYFGYIGWGSFPIALVAGSLLTLAIGIWPGIRASAVSIEHALRGSRRAGLSESPLATVHGRLVAASTAVTVMLLVCASLLALSARALVKDARIPDQRTFTSLLTFDESRGRTHRADVAREVLTRLRAQGTIRFAVLGPLPAEAAMVVLRAGLDGGPVRRLSATQLHDVSDGYFEALGIRLVHGRGFSARESHDSTSGIVISKTVAAAVFGRGNPVGRRFHYGFEGDSILREATVLGIAENASGGAKHQLYRSYGQHAPSQVPLVVRGKNTRILPAEIKRTLHEVPSVLSSDVGPPRGNQESGLRLIRYTLLGFGLFAVVGMVLAAIGTYGVVAYSVARRTHEIGVRIALGARRTNVTWLIVEQGLRATLTGTIFGLVLSFAAARILSIVLFDVRNDYMLSMVVVVLLVIVISAIASLIPAQRAGGLNPVDALRIE